MGGGGGGGVFPTTNKGHGGCPSGIRNIYFREVVPIIYSPTCRSGTPFIKKSNT